MVLANITLTFQFSFWDYINCFFWKNEHRVLIEKDPTAPSEYRYAAAIAMEGMGIFFTRYRNTTHTLTYILARQITEKYDGAGKEFVFIIDCSGSMVIYFSLPTWFFLLIIKSKKWNINVT